MPLKLGSAGNLTSAEGHGVGTVYHRHQEARAEDWRKEHCIYYRPDRVSPSDFEPLLKQFFDRTNRLSQSGELLAEMILPTIEDYYFSVLSDE